MTQRQAPAIRAAVQLAIVLALTACATPPLDTIGRSRIERVAVPAGVVLPDGAAIAFRAAGKNGTVIRDAEVSTRPLLSRGVKATAGFQIYEESGGYYRAIAHRQRGDRLVADIVAGKTYLIAPVYTGHLRASLFALCRLTIEEPRRRVADIPRICTQILCAPELFSAGSLAKTYGPLPGDLDPSLELGGWSRIPQDLCGACTRAGNGPGELPTLSFVCPAAPTPACQQGEVLFNDDFEADTIGSAPAASPAGPPPGDAVSVSGDVTVVAASSKAARLRRGNSHAQFDGAFDSGATASGSYCVKFTGQAGDNMREPVLFTFNAANGARAWQLTIDSDAAKLTGGGVDFNLARDFTVPRDFRFDVDLDLMQFDMFVDGVQVVSNMAFLDTTFDVPSELRFELGQCILECFSAEYTVDNFRVTKTD